MLVDAIGNAIGNSIVNAGSKQPEISSSETFSIPGEAEFGSGVAGSGNTGAIDLTPTDEQIARFFQDESTNEFLQGRADEQFAIDNLAASLGDDPFGFARTSVGSDLSRVDLSQSTYSTIDNPFGLLPEQLSRSNYLASYIGGSFEAGNLSHYEKLQYDYAVTQNFDSLSGAQFGPRDREFEAFQRNQKLDAQEFFSQSSPQTRVAQQLTDFALFTRGGRFAFGGVGIASTINSTEIQNFSDFVSDGADVRLSLGFKNERDNFEAKIYGGTDFPLALSVKSGELELSGNARFSSKTNGSVHYRFASGDDILNGNFTTTTIGEFDTSRAIPTGKIKIGNVPVSTSLTPGFRLDTQTGDVRGSANLKFELPKSFKGIFIYQAIYQATHNKTLSRIQIFITDFQCANGLD